MYLSPLLLALLQQPAAPTLPPSPVVKVEITPAGGELQIGQTLQLAARALDASGQPVPNARVYWFVGSDNGVSTRPGWSPPATPDPCGSVRWPPSWAARGSRSASPSTAFFPSRRPAWKSRPCRRSWSPAPASP